MKKIKLFHSYIYLQNSKNIKCIDNKIYDNNNNFVLGLLNIPKENDLYKIIIQKNLISNKLSKKKIPSYSYYNKNNAKVFLEIDYEKLYTYIKNNLNIPYKNELFNLLEQNYVHLLENNKNIYDVLCINKHCRKDISYMETLIYQNVNPYIFDIYQLSFNIKTKEITEQHKITNKIDSSNNGYLFICDNIHYTISTFLNKDILSATLVVTENKNIWSEYLSKTNSKMIVCNLKELIHYKNKTFFRIIYDNINPNLNLQFNLNTEKKWYISNDVSKLNIQCLKIILNKFLNIKLFDIDESILYSLSKIIYYKNFFDYYKKNKSLIVNNHKLNNYELPRFEPTLLKNKSILDDFCCICYNKFELNSLCKTSCQPVPHYFCQSCITKILSNNQFGKCPTCRQKIDNNKIKKVITNPNILIEKNKELSSLMVKLLNRNTNNIIICISSQKYLKFVKNILNLLNKDSKCIYNEKSLFENMNSFVCIINLNQFDYNIVNKISKRKKVDIYSINTTNNFNKFLINLKKYYDHISCDALI